MNLLYLFISMCLASADVIGDSKCIIKEKTMNCTGLNLTDCPEMDKSIQNLILDFNLLTTLSTDSCKKLAQLHELSIQNNSLTALMDFQNFTFLNSINLRGNQLTNITINADSLLKIDVSFNHLIYMDVGKPIGLTQLNISHNSLDEKEINKLIKSIHVSNKITVLDLSYNQMKMIPMEFNTFSPLNLNSLNIAGNQLSFIDFSSFKPNMGNYLSLNLSGNMITRCIVKEEHTIKELDLSHNLLPNINASHLDRLKGPPKLDLSGNPLNCLCNESAAFIDWVHRHEDILVHKQETRCAVPSKLDLNIFNITCSLITTPSSSSSTSSSVTKTTATSSTPSVSTEKPPVRSNGWQIAVGVMCPLIIIILIVLTGWCYCNWQRRGYTILGGSRNSNSNIACDCFPLASIRSRRQSNLVIDPEQDSQHIYSENHLSITDTLSIICSSKETKWLNENIANYLDVNVQFIDSAVVRLPHADFTLIFVNGDLSLRDSVLIENVKLLLQERDQSDIKLLVSSIPDFDRLTVKTVNEATKYIRNNIKRRGHFFQWDLDNRASCLLDLKSWLQSSNVLQNV